MCIFSAIRAWHIKERNSAQLRKSIKKARTYKRWRKLNKELDYISGKDYEWMQHFGAILDRTVV